MACNAFMNNLPENLKNMTSREQLTQSVSFLSWLSEPKPFGELMMAFDWVRRTQINKGTTGGHAYFPSKSYPNNQNEKMMIACISHTQSIDDSLLSSHGNFRPSWPINLSYGQ